MPRIVAPSYPCLPNWVRAAARILSLVPPAPGRLPVRAMHGEVAAGGGLGRGRAPGYELARDHQDQAAEKPQAQDPERDGDAGVVEVEGAPDRAEELARRHARRQPAIRVRKQLASDRAARADQ